MKKVPSKSTIQQFVRLLTLRDRTLDRQSQKRKELQIAFETELFAEFRSRFKTRKQITFALCKEKMSAETDAIYNKWKDKAYPVYDRQRAAMKKLDQMLDDVAQDVPVATTTEYWSLVETVSDDTYRSQGWGKAKYAKTDAELTAAKYKMLGILTELVRVSGEERFGSFGTYTVGAEWQVWAPADSVMIELIRRKDGLEIKDFLKLCWSRASNPRVINSFLPNGLEEKLGVNYHGGNIGKAK